ncbi:DUF3750 domain-containing protein [Arhodomonas aquaeolei]|uniref:DUF3750 domain-containing protein n=1 Tax=Arhodomonas aquaeolei TaxID=2369 RepID=UPI0003665061|nr:DUF3750 domain-containing protein [Arhodomonas aquaeolei]
MSGRRRRLAVVTLLALMVTGPAVMWASGGFVVEGDWRTASRASAGIAPVPGAAPEAIVQVYAARAFEWRGAFAVHTWIATKPAGGGRYTVYQVTGWGGGRVHRSAAEPDRAWFGAPPRLLADIRGPRAAALIPHIDAAVDDYPFPHTYRSWPGPNSNTFTAWVIRHVDGLSVALPPTALGKDYLADGVLARVPSGSGYQLSLYGLAGVGIAAEEGLTVNVLGLELGVAPWPPALVLPGVGRLGPSAPGAQRPVPAGEDQARATAASSAAVEIANSAR